MASSRAYSVRHAIGDLFADALDAVFHTLRLATIPTDGSAGERCRPKTVTNKLHGEFMRKNKSGACPNLPSSADVDFAL